MSEHAVMPPRISAVAMTALPAGVTGVVPHTASLVKRLRLLRAGAVDPGALPWCVGCGSGHHVRIPLQGEFARGMVARFI